jgi:hypothetical protein
MEGEGRDGSQFTMGVNDIETHQIERQESAETSEIHKSRKKDSGPDSRVKTPEIRKLSKLDSAAETTFEQLISRLAELDKKRRKAWVSSAERFEQLTIASKLLGRSSAWGNRSNETMLGKIFGASRQIKDMEEIKA